MGYSTSARSRWLDIGQFRFFRHAYGGEAVKVYKYARKFIFLNDGNWRKKGESQTADILTEQQRVIIGPT